MLVSVCHVESSMQHGYSVNLCFRFYPTLSPMLPPTQLQRLEPHGPWYVDKAQADLRSFLWQSMFRRAVTTIEGWAIEALRGIDDRLCVLLAWNRMSSFRINPHSTSSLSCSCSRWALSSRRDGFTRWNMSSTFRSVLLIVLTNIGQRVNDSVSYVI